MPRNTDGGKRVLVTRTQPGADQLARMLAAAGYLPVVEPLIEIVALHEAATVGELAKLDTYDVVVFLSVHAVTQALDPAQRVWSTRTKPPLWIGVGAATRAALIERGLDALSPADERSEGILSMPEFEPIANKRVLLVAGSDGRRLLDETLAARGATVQRVDVYRRRAVTDGARIDLAQFDFVVVSSVATADVLLHRAGALPAVQPRMIVPSQRVGEALRGGGLARIVVAAGAGAAATLSAIESCEGRNE